MAVLGKRTIVLLLGVLVLLSLGLRYPTVEHERYQTDSYFIHTLSQSIIEKDQAPWIFNPLSYFGLYPYSYPSGVPFLLAEVSMMTGLSLEVSILFLDFILAISFCLGVFILARNFLTRPEYAILATAFAVTASRFVDTTYWNGSARGAFVVLVVLIVFAAFRSSQLRQRSLLIVTALLLFACFTAHHMAVLLILFAAAYVVAVFQTRILLRRTSIRRRVAVVIFNFTALLTIIIAAFNYVGFFGNLLINRERLSWIPFDIPVLSAFLGVSISYTAQIGFVIVAALFGIVVVLKDNRLSVESLFPLTLVIAMVPLVGNSLYISMLIAPMVAIMGTIWVASVFRNARKRRLAVVIIVLLLISSVLFPIWNVQRWNDAAYEGGDTVEVDSGVFNDAAYLDFVGDREFVIFNANVLALELASNSHTTFFASGVGATLNGDITAEKVAENLTWSEANFPVNLYLWYSYKNDPRFEVCLSGLMIMGLRFVNGTGSFPVVTEYYQSHPRLFVVIDENHPDAFVDAYSVRGAMLPSQLRSTTWTDSFGGTQDFSSYVIYESERTSLYVVELPV